MGTKQPSSRPLLGHPDYIVFADASTYAGRVQDVLSRVEVVEALSGRHLRIGHQDYPLPSDHSRSWSAEVPIKGQKAHLAPNDVLIWLQGHLGIAVIVALRA